MSVGYSVDETLHHKLPLSSPGLIQLRKGFWRGCVCVFSKNEINDFVSVLRFVHIESETVNS